MITNEIKFIEMAHIFLCNKEHSNGGPEQLKNRSPNICYFFQEASMEDRWNQPDHKYWKEEGLKLIRKLEARDAKEAEMKLKELLQLIRRINEVTPNTGGAGDIVRELL